MNVISYRNLHFPSSIIQRATCPHYPVTWSESVSIDFMPDLAVDVITVGVNP
jgi:hypothetical protein